MKPSFCNKAKNHNVQIGGMVTTDNIGLIAGQLLFISKPKDYTDKNTAEQAVCSSQFIQETVPFLFFCCNKIQWIKENEKKKNDKERVITVDLP